MNDVNGYKIAQIAGLGLAFLMIFMLTVVGWYETSTMVTWFVLLLVGVGVAYGAGKLDEMGRDRQRDEELAHRREDREREDRERESRGLDEEFREGSHERHSR